MRVQFGSIGSSGALRRFWLLGTSVLAMSLLCLRSPAEVSAAKGGDPAPYARAQEEPPEEGTTKDAPEADAPAPKVKTAAKPAGSAAEKAAEKAAVKASAAKAASSIDEKYVLENLERYLHPTKMEVLKDGRVKLLYEFARQDPAHEAIFTPNIAKDVQSKFRWSLRYEYGYSWGWDGLRGEDGTWYYGALRIGDSGNAHINAWFKDDLEAEIWFASGTSSSKSQVASVVFTNAAGNSLGSNWGTQVTPFQKGRPRGGKGTVETAVMEKSMRIKLVVRNGNFEAHRDGRMRQTMEYKPKDFSSGKIGVMWANGVAGFIYKMEIIARFDAEKMAKLLRKSPPK